MRGLTTTVKETQEHMGYTIDLTTEFFGDRISGQRANIVVDGKHLSFTSIKVAKDYIAMLNYIKAGA